MDMNLKKAILAWEKEIISKYGLKSATVRFVIKRENRSPDQCATFTPYLYYRWNDQKQEYYFFTRAQEGKTHKFFRLRKDGNKVPVFEKDAECLETAEF